MKNLLLYLVCFMICASGASAWGETYGLTGIRPVWDGAAPTDGTGVRFQFYVAENYSQNLKIIFGDSRLRGPGADTYLLEYNIYDRGLQYDDGVHTTWPLEGTYVNQAASLRVAVPDYILKGKTGAKTFAPEMFPRQTYEIDGINGLWKTDLITQTNLNQIEGSVTVTRGNIVSDLSGWRTDGTDLPLDTYRQWNVAVSFDQQTYNMAFALPDANAQYLASWEPLLFSSEFLNGAGLFRVDYWGFAIMHEGSGQWEPINTWQVSHHDGSLENFGVSLSSYADIPVIEFSNDPALTHLATNTIIDITPKPVPEPGTLFLFIIGALTVMGNISRRTIQQLNG